MAERNISIRPERMLRLLAGAGLAAALVAGCSGGDTSDSTTSESASGVPPASAQPDAGLVGSGCASYAATNTRGSASFAGMAIDPVATAVSHNPLLRQLAAAISGRLNRDVDLTETLNGSQFTVFAPVDAGFAKVPAETTRSFATDSALLTKILTYHLVPGRISPAQIDGTHKTIEGHDLTVDGSGNDIRVNRTTSVVCGGIVTENAAVYLVDSVLVPTA